MDSEVEHTRRWIDAARRGDREAYEELFRLHHVHLTRAARKLGARHGRLSRSDVVQEALIDAVHAFDRFEYRGRGSFRRWLHALLANRVHSAWKEAHAAKRDARRELRRPLLADTDATSDPGLAELATSETSPSSAVARREDSDALSRALELLPPDHREVIHLVKLRGLDIAQTAATLGRSENAVKKLLARALLGLRAELKDDCE